MDALLADGHTVRALARR
ncbi:MAG: hypothetical protein M3466_10130 [Gemmatimonadota bacterium]|nr:hypothetical protein [Gemmatimonadota bacterium]